MRYFTQYRANQDWFDAHEKLETSGGAPTVWTRTASSMFRKRGVVAGDALYLVTILSGQFYVAARMEIGEILSYEEAKRRLKNDNLWAVSDHLFARRATAFDYTIEISLPITARLLFYKGERLATLKFSKPGWLDSQTLRGIREMPQETAKKLDEFLPPMLSVKN